MRLRLRWFMYAGLVAWVMTFYFLATGVHDWKLWVAVSIAFAERAVLQLRLFLIEYVARTMTRRIMEQIQAGNLPNIESSGSDG